LKKVKKKWSHELKYATTTTKTKFAKVRAKLKTIGCKKEVTADSHTPVLIKGSVWHSNGVSLVV